MSSSQQNRGDAGSSVSSDEEADTVGFGETFATSANAMFGDVMHSANGMLVNGGLGAAGSKNNHGQFASAAQFASRGGVSTSSPPSIAVGGMQSLSTPILTSSSFLQAAAAAASTVAAGLVSHAKSICQWIGCGLDFATLDMMVEHLMIEHVKSRRNNHDNWDGFCGWTGCVRNGRAFTTRQKLVTHLRTHTGEKPYECTINNCGKHFSRLDILTKHMRSHSGAKPFACPVQGCGKRFSEAKSLEHHSTSHTAADKPFVCVYPGCGRRYSDVASLYRHSEAHISTAAAAMGRSPDVKSDQQQQQQQQQPHRHQHQHQPQQQQQQPHIHQQQHQLQQFQQLAAQQSQAFLQQQQQQQQQFRPHLSQSQPHMISLPMQMQQQQQQQQQQRFIQGVMPFQQVVQVPSQTHFIAHQGQAVGMFPSNVTLLTPSSNSASSLGFLNSSGSSSNMGFVTTAPAPSMAQTPSSGSKTTTSFADMIDMSYPSLVQHQKPMVASQMQQQPQLQMQMQQQQQQQQQQASSEPATDDVAELIPSALNKLAAMLSVDNVVQSTRQQITNVLARVTNLPPGTDCSDEDGEYVSADEQFSAATLARGQVRESLRSAFMRSAFVNSEEICELSDSSEDEATVLLGAPTSVSRPLPMQLAVGGQTFRTRRMRTVDDALRALHPTAFDTESDSDSAEEAAEDLQPTAEEYRIMLRLHKMQKRMSRNALRNPRSYAPVHQYSSLFLRGSAGAIDDPRLSNKLKLERDMLDSEIRHREEAQRRKDAIVRRQRDAEELKQRRVQEQEQIRLAIHQRVANRFQRATVATAASTASSSTGQHELPAFLEGSDDTELVTRRHIWMSIALNQVVPAHALRASAVQASRSLAQATARMVTSRMQQENARAQRQFKDSKLRARRLNREMFSFWKKNEKDERESRRRAEREEIDKRKMEMEMREQERQKRKLNFLLTQTELYAHFMSRKLQTNSTSEDEILSRLNAPTDLDSKNPDGDVNALRAQARQHAENAYQSSRTATEQFDTESQRLRQEASEDDELSLANPRIADSSLLSAPSILVGTLKSYQLKGMSWLASLYDQGINGILADEMGLGKTIQTIALLAHIAEKHNTWGPFLIVTPASTLHNWQQEIERFVPSFKVLPYWGHANDRKVLRKYFNNKLLYTKDAAFHVLVTSYQMIVFDDKYFQRVKWQYMVLDEAQAIKSSASVRWNTLLKFNCRNRLLLTGTPIQNSMTELWALLHFIMPSVFDSHQEFSEWFAKDIESHAENKSGLDKTQLSRLHMILKPFMLRRVKKDVENELGEKIELLVPCYLTSRQRQLYQGLQSRLTVDELLSTSAPGGSSSSQRAPDQQHLMNMIMQFRKVCNHPELFERRRPRSPFQFQAPLFSVSQVDDGTPRTFKYGEAPAVDVGDVNRNAISFSIPKLVYRESLLLPSNEHLRTCALRFNIFHPSNVHACMLGVNDQRIDRDVHNKPTSPRRWVRTHSTSRSGFSFVRLMRVSHSDLLIGLGPAEVFLCDALRQQSRREVYDPEVTFSNSIELVPVATRLLHCRGDQAAQLQLPLLVFSTEYKNLLSMGHFGSDLQFWMAPAVARPVEFLCSDASFVRDRNEILRSPGVHRLLFGPTGVRSMNEARNRLDPSGPVLIGLPRLPVERNFASRPLVDGGMIDRCLFQLRDPVSSELQLARLGLVNNSVPRPVFSHVSIPDRSRLITDSIKMVVLDKLLTKLKAEGHRVLIYSQMTKMIDLLEEFMNFRLHRYVRLDGQTTIETRNNMVSNFQTRSDIFVFLLSTRAGGVGINLTAADTVIFYDSDWNPTVDQQAMDRSHRLGQTRQVTVYRLIAKGTVEERILARARQKSEIHKMVIAGGHFRSEPKANDVVSILLGDEQDNQQLVTDAVEGDLLEGAIQLDALPEAPDTSAESLAAMNGAWNDEGAAEGLEQLANPSKKTRRPRKPRAPAGAAGAPRSRQKRRHKDDDGSGEEVVLQPSKRSRRAGPSAASSNSASIIPPLTMQGDVLDDNDDVDITGF